MADERDTYKYHFKLGNKITEFPSLRRIFSS